MTELAAAQKFLIDLETTYVGAFENSRFYNFPSWPSAVPNSARRVGWPEATNAAIDEIFNKF